MSLHPIVSVVMPAYNAARYIKASINSVLAQSFRSLELIVVDDCSSDDTNMIVKQLASSDDRIRLIELKENRGAPAAPRNVGVQQAKGQWIAFLDADDIWHAEKLACQLKALESTGALFCSTSMLNFTSEDDLSLGPVTEEVEEISFQQQLIKFRTPTSSVVVNKDLISRHPFNEDRRYKAREDLECWLRCHEEIGHSVKVRSALLGYRIVPGQISGLKWQMVKRHLLVLREYRLRGGSKLGLLAYIFTFTHFALAVYQRRLRGRL